MPEPITDDLLICFFELFLQMETCQSGFYNEDYRTQEVPAGLDFTAYGELTGLKQNPGLDLV